MVLGASGDGFIGALDSTRATDLCASIQGQDHLFAHRHDDVGLSILLHSDILDMDPKNPAKSKRSRKGICGLSLKTGAPEAVFMNDVRTIC